MRIISWNVNGLRARIDAVRSLAKEFNPDLLCCQKTRSTAGSLFEIEGYTPVIIDESPDMLGGVATYIRNDFPIDMANMNFPMSDWLRDSACVLTVPSRGAAFVNAYFPFAESPNGDWNDHRKIWNREFKHYIKCLSREMPVVICGDMNIVDYDIDAWDGKSVKTAPGFYLWEHQDFDLLKKEALLADAYRAQHPLERGFTYFYQNRDEYRDANSGYRIDYFLLSSWLMPQVKDCRIITTYRDTSSNPILLDLNDPE